MSRDVFDFLDDVRRRPGMLSGLEPRSLLALEALATGAR
jgi:hypothetical protein